MTSERIQRVEQFLLKLHVLRLVYPRCANPIITLLYYIHYASKLMKS